MGTDEEIYEDAGREDFAGLNRIGSLGERASEGQAAGVFERGLAVGGSLAGRSQVIQN